MQINVQVLKNDLLGALKEGCAAIKGFGMDLPPFPDEDAYQRQLKATMDLVKQHSLGAILNLPLLENREVGVLQEVLQESFLPAYFNDSNNMGIFTAKIVEDTFRHGLSKNTVFGCTNFGLVLAARGRSSSATSSAR